MITLVQDAYDVPTVDVNKLTLLMGKWMWFSQKLINYQPSISDWFILPPWKSRYIWILNEPTELQVFKGCQKATSCYMLSYFMKLEINFLYFIILESCSLIIKPAKCGWDQQLEQPAASSLPKWPAAVRLPLIKNNETIVVWTNTFTTSNTLR